jgi:ASC-1-like (ASCH) protein
MDNAPPHSEDEVKQPTPAPTRVAMHGRIIEVSDPWWTHIRDGTKTVEGRKGSPEWKSIAAGDTMKIRRTILEPEEPDTTPQEMFTVRVVRVTHYETISEYLSAETLARTLPGVATVEAGVAVYSQWWEPAMVNMYGVLAIELEVR